MHTPSLTSPGMTARCGDARAMAQALQDSRRDTLATFSALQRALPDLRVPLQGDLNPPLWELGHIGWFQEYWLARNPCRDDGAAADPMATRKLALRPNADALYNSSEVPHDSRWTLALPDVEGTRAELSQQLEQTLQLLGGLHGADDQRLYFYRLCLHHEDMHHEAALYMARALGIAIDDPRWQPHELPPPPAALDLPAGRWQLGSEAGAGFAFDNELAAHEVDLPASRIDAQVLRWAEYLPFVESGGAAQAQWWSAAGWAWHQAQPTSTPRYLRREGDAWQQWRHGRWQALNRTEAACHLSCFEAEAWCRWAGRRLPSEAEWERAALSRPEAFRWGDVWEWTTSAFQPYPGFVPHPYRDYSAPWFDGRPVLRGASFMTQPRMRHARYRNYFLPQRSDVPAGLRSCAL